MGVQRNLTATIALELSHSLKMGHDHSYAVELLSALTGEKLRLRLFAVLQKALRDAKLLLCQDGEGTSEKNNGHEDFHKLILKAITPRRCIVHDSDDLQK